MFTGFAIDYPEYTVITPQTGLVYGVRYLNVSEVSRIKSSITVPSKAGEVINKVLYNALVTKPKGINSYEDFMKVTTLRDREALLYGLYITTFDEDCEFEPKCRECEKENRLKVKLSDMFEINAFPGSNAVKSSYKFMKATGSDSVDEEIEQNIIKEQKFSEPVPSAEFIKKVEKGEIVSREEMMERRAEAMRKVMENSDPFAESDLSKEGITLDKKPEAGDELMTVMDEIRNKTGILNKLVEITLPKSGVRAVLRQPTMYHEKQITDTIPMVPKNGVDLSAETLIIDRFDVYRNESTKPIQSYTERNDILEAYQALPNPDKKYIYEKFNEHFGDYGITLKLDYACKECGADNQINLDITMQFFRMVIRS